LQCAWLVDSTVQFFRTNRCESTPRMTLVIAKGSIPISINRAKTWGAVPA